MNPSVRWNCAFVVMLVCYSASASAEPQGESPFAAIIDVLSEQGADLSIDESDFKTIRRSGNTFLVPRALRRKLLFNMSTMGSQASLIRVRDKQKVIGYRVEDISPRGILPYLGIKTGDIVRTVNGRLIQSEQEALELATDLSLSDQVRVELERGAQRQPVWLTYKLVS